MIVREHGDAANKAAIRAVGGIEVLVTIVHNGDDGSSGKGAAVQRLQEAGLPSFILTAAHGGYAEWYVQFWMKRVELVRSKAPRRRAHLQPRVCVVYSMYNLLIINLLMYALSTTHVQTPAHMVCTQVDRVVAHRG